ncbi:MAG: homogentisate 1,2-dioxygenase, partial [Microbacterium sp.]
MVYYKAVGEIPPKRHTQFRVSESDTAPGTGAFYYEELMGEEGFSSDSSLLYHRYIPSAMLAARPWDITGMETVPNTTLIPRHLRLHDLFDTADIASVDAVTGRRLVMGNADVRILYAVVGAVSPWYRDGIGDECVYVEAGSGRVETIFGVLEVGEGDYVIIPRATTHRWVPDENTATPLRLYIVEANSHITPPKRYRSKHGQLLEHSPYCERDLRTPAGRLLAEDIGEDPAAPTEVYIKHRGVGNGGIAGTIHTTP